jgi:hypothetical protein
MTKKYDHTALAYNKRGKLIAVAKNSYVKTHPLQAKFGKESGKPNAIYLHAELAVLIKAREPVHRLVVLRFDSKGTPANSAPCASCQLAIKHYGVRHVEHS